MAETIWVRAKDPKGRVAHWERADDHPGGEVFVAGEDVVEVARTPDIERKLAKGVLVETTAPDSVQALSSGEGDDENDTDPITEAVGAEIAGFLAEAGYTTTEAVQAASDDELLTVKSIGDGRLRTIRNVLPYQEPTGDTEPPDGSQPPSASTQPVPAVPVTPPPQTSTPLP